MQLNRGYEVNWGAMPLSGVLKPPTAPCAWWAVSPRTRCCAFPRRWAWTRTSRSAPSSPNLAEQFKHKPALQAIFRERIATNTTEYWTTRLEDQGLLNAPVHTLEQALADAQTEANGMVVEAEHPGVGTVRMLNAPIRLSATPPTVRRVAPRLGERTRGGPAGERLRRRDHRTPAAAGGAPVTAVSVEGTGSVECAASVEGTAGASSNTAPVDRVP